MISHSHKYIFVHVTKTAGTTIRCAMEGTYDELHKPHHSDIAKIKKNLSDKIFRSYFKFGTVRNPWEREVSRYKYLQRLPLAVAPQSTYCRNGFKAYLLKFAELGPVNYDALRIGGKIAVDYVMKFENLQEDFDTVCDKIGIPRRGLTHENKTRHKHYTEYYTDETIKIIAENYARDIEYFGYNFGD